MFTMVLRDRSISSRPTTNPGEQVVEVRCGARAHVTGEVLGQQAERERRMIGAQQRQYALVREQGTVFERAGET